MQPGDEVKYLTEGGERFSGTVAKVDGNQVTIEYDASRTDLVERNATTRSFHFGVAGTVGDQLKSSLGRLLDGDRFGSSGPNLDQVISEFAALLGLAGDNQIKNSLSISYDPATKIFSITPTFTPDPLAFETRLDLGGEIKDLSIGATGDFMVSVTPTLRLPIGINLSTAPGIPAGERVFLRGNTSGDANFDPLPEVSLVVTANLDNPRVRAELGFLSGTLKEDAAITPNGGIAITTTFAANIQDIDFAGDPNDSANDGRLSIRNLLRFSEIKNAIVPTVTGTVDIDGLIVTAEAAGATIPGQINIFTTSDGTPGTKGETAVINNLNDLKTLFSSKRITIDPNLGSFGELRPADVVAMFLQLGNALQSVADSLDAPEGLPFIDEAISDVVSFVDTLEGFAQKLYFNPQVLGNDDIQVTNRQLSQDAFFTVQIGGALAPVLVKVTKASTAANVNINQLVAQVQAAINNALAPSLTAAGFTAPFVIVERPRPFNVGDSKLTSIADTTGAALPNYVEPLPAGFKRVTANFAAGVNLFDEGIKVGSVVYLTDVAGNRVRAVVDDLKIREVTVRYESAAVPAWTSVNFHDPDDVNKLSIRTASTEIGTSLRMGTVMVTGQTPGPDSGQLSAPLAFDVVVDGETTSISVPVSAMSANANLADLLNDINDAFTAAELADVVRAFADQATGAVKFAAVSGGRQSLSINGAQQLGFAASQDQDANTAASELGLGIGAAAAGAFRINSIQDLVHTLNGLIQTKADGVTPFSTSLTYIAESESVQESVQFNISLSEEFRRAIDVRFDTGLDLGFADLELFGSAGGEFIASANIDLQVGIDLGPVGGSQAVTAATKVADLNDGLGLQFNVGAIAATPMAVNGQGEPVVASDLNLSIHLKRLDSNGALTSTSPNLALTITTAEAADATSVADLAAILNDKLATTTGVTVTNGIPSLGFSVQSIANRSLADFGVNLVLADTLSIALRDGTSFAVNLSGATTLIDVKSKIEEQSRLAGFSSDRVKVVINETSRALDLTDLTESSKVPGAVKPAFTVSGTAATKLKIAKSAVDTTDSAGMVVRTSTVRGDALTSTGWLALIANDPTIIGLTLDGGATLGFAASQPSNRPDIRIQTRNGGSFDINLDASTLAGSSFTLANLPAAMPAGSDIKTDGDGASVAEVQIVDLVTGGRLAGIVEHLNRTVGTLEGDSVSGTSEVRAVVDKIREQVTSQANLFAALDRMAKEVFDAIEDRVRAELGIAAPNIFEITPSIIGTFVDADSVKPGFQPTLLVGLHDQQRSEEQLDWQAATDLR